MSLRGEAIRNNLSNEYEKTPGYLIWDITEAVGQEMDKQDDEAKNTRALFDIDNQNGEELERTVKQYKGIIRRAATNAIGILKVSGNGTVTVGDLFETENGVQFMATETVEIIDIGDVQIEAVIPGNAGVVGANTINQMPVTLAGIVSCNNEEPTRDGYDAESDDSLRERYYAKLQMPDNGVNKYAYRNFALEVPGVGDAEVFPLGHGENTVDVVIIDMNKLPASEELVTTTQEYIDPGSRGTGEGRAQMGAHCYVSSADGMDINISGKLTINGEQEAIEETTKIVVSEYLASIAYSGQNVSYARIGDRILDVPGVLDVENLAVNGGIVNIEVPERSIAVLGTAVFEYA